MLPHKLSLLVFVSVQPPVVRLGNYSATDNLAGRGVGSLSIERSAKKLQWRINLSLAEQLLKPFQDTHHPNPKAKDNPPAPAVRVVSNDWG